MTTTEIVKPRLLEKYRKDVSPVLMQEFRYKSLMQVPRVSKIVINMGVKEGQQDIKILDQLAVELGMITGQKPLVTKAKKSIAAFKLREGSSIGLKVTLRKNRMFEFMDRLFNVAMPQIRDFRGYSEKSFDGRGNFSLGITEQMIFPEVEFEKVKMIHGMDITFVTTAKNGREGKRLLELMGLPFKKD